MVAGLTAAAVVIPKAMAYAAIAGLPVEAGLYTAFVPMAVYALLGTSRPLSVSTTSTIAILTAGALALVAPNASPAELVTAEETLREHGTTLWLAGLNPEVLRLIEQAPLGKVLGRERIFPTLEEAVRRYQA